MLVKSWAIVVDDEPTLNQHWVNVMCLLDKDYTTGQHTVTAAN